MIILVQSCGNKFDEFFPKWLFLFLFSEHVSFEIKRTAVYPILVLMHSQPILVLMHNQPILVLMHSQPILVLMHSQPIFSHD